MTLTPALVDVGSTLEGTSGVVQYLLVFVFAMIPLIEPFIVIPVAIGLGLDPVATGLAAFGGSVTAVTLIVLAHERVVTWWMRRRASPDDGADSSARYDRARRLWDRYGNAGLAFAGPLLAGLHLTALVGAVVGRDTRILLGWLTIGLGAWTGAIVAASVFGLSLLGLA
ncbi:small multi-drug export protein [Natrarchaeobaculum aegyptiacum]|uniref:Small multi-drug export protein n=1 Tax=Natrarchaeobaculum aegyptiacum TaxID=745377 RepID=A0A2Z2I1U4_9EURY|nr:small multi-drug export protein [Natrarchaeobaculum aegyptiacum]ARS90548.1 small multi-drug export protein [Natrarchaeobaculum aegyptiacum]